MADNLNKLLMYIVDHPLRQEESKEAEREASAVQDVSAEIKGLVQEQKKGAEKLAPYFAQGLRQATTQFPFVVDDATEEGGNIAEAFARYLVTPGLATSQSAELPGNHFQYTFEVNWDMLRSLAGRAGIDLDAALRTTQ